MFPPLPDWTADEYDADAVLDGLLRMTEWIRRLKPLTGGDVVPFVTPGGTYWMGGGGGGGAGLLRAQAPAGGIASGATGIVTLYGADHSLGSETLEAANRTPGAVAGSAMILIAWIAREGEYQVVNEVCS